MKSRYEVIDGVHIHRHPLPIEAKGALGFPAGIWRGAVLGNAAGVAHLFQARDRT
jgi:hypothetical protein